MTPPHPEPRRLRIGVLTRNFPPAHGGMAEHAAGLAQALGALADVLVFAPPECRAPASPTFELRPVLHRDADDNRALLSSIRVDCWLALSAHFAGLGHLSPVPYFVYVHGNDFLQPNPNPGRSMEARLARVPGLWRCRPWLARWLDPRRLRARRAALARGLQDARCVYVNSAYTGGLLRDALGRLTPPVRVSHPGCAERFFQAPEPGADRPLQLLTVCRLDPSTRRKNVDGVLTALSRIGRSIDWRYTVVGGGEDLPRLQQLAGRLGVSGSIRFLGWVPPDELLRCYRQAQLFVLCPRAAPADVEGFGMVYVEANASGVPVLASRAGGAVEAIRPGVTGLLLPDSEAHTIAEGLTEFARERQRFTPQRLQEFAAGFRWPRIADALLEDVRARL